VRPQDDDHKALLQRNIDEDTRILATKFVRVAGIPILFERWCADGVSGSSAVFLNEHVAGMADASLQEFLTQAGIEIGGSATFVRRETHTFLNFAFEAK
jgi:hypothetical protein